MPTLGQKHRHLDMSWLLIGHNRTAKVRIYLLIINIFRKKVEKTSPHQLKNGDTISLHLRFISLNIIF